MAYYNNTTSGLMVAPQASSDGEVESHAQLVARLLMTKPYIEISPSVAMTYVAIVSMALVVGTMGNLLVILAFGVSNAARTVGNEFIINLAIADLCVTAIADPLCILGVTHGRSYFDVRPILCEFIACLCLSACFCAFFNLMLVTLNRYVYICHNKYYKTIFSRPKIIGMCIGAWILAFAMESPNFIGWNGHGFDMKQLQCTWMRMRSFWYTVFINMFLILTPLILMTLAYSLIFLNIFQSKKKVFSHGILTFSASKKKELKLAIQTARSLFIVVLAFLVCWTPYAIVMVIDYTDRLPLGLHLWVTLLAHLHSSLNCFIHALTNSAFREASVNLSRAVFRGLSTSSVSSTSNNTLTSDVTPGHGKTDKSGILTSGSSGSNAENVEGNGTKNGITNINGITAYNGTTTKNGTINGSGKLISIGHSVMTSDGQILVNTISASLSDIKSHTNMKSHAK